MRFLRSLLWVLLLTGLSFSPATAGAQQNIDFSFQVQRASPIDADTLQKEIADRITRVPEFRYIREVAGELRVKVYLFGGTAAGFAHYVNWDLLREKGDERFQPNRFDYDYTNIYRSNQDLDIVVDGPAAKAQKLKELLRSRYPHFQGSKEAWEIRLLRSGMADKMALLDNPDFLNQHTDSNSTGLVEVTKPSQNSWPVKDLRDWKTRDSYFLEDVRLGKLHYYYSPQHDSTSRAKQGLNPPILSVIRYLTKAFQYELAVTDKDLRTIQKIIDDFDPKTDLENGYVEHWIEKNGTKLIQNAVNIEYAWNMLNDLGLRKKLSSVGKAREVGSLAWWMNKEPLRSKEVDGGSGKTAAELKIKIVAHETNNFLAYESITRSHTGAPNVLISRQGFSGENAAYGDGFYTRIGKEGAAGTGLTIRFWVNPQAREGKDFQRHSDYVVFLNKNALRVIPESLNIDVVGYFRMLAKGKAFDQADKGILEKLKRRISNQFKNLDSREIEKVLSIVKKAVVNKTKSQENVLKEWFALPASGQHPEILDSFWKGTKEQKKWLCSYVNWSYFPEKFGFVLEAALKDKTGGLFGSLIDNESVNANTSTMEPLLQAVIRSKNQMALRRMVMSIDAKTSLSSLMALMDAAARLKDGETMGDVIAVASSNGHPIPSELIDYGFQRAKALEDGKVTAGYIWFLKEVPNDMDYWRKHIGPLYEGIPPAERGDFLESIEELAGHDNSVLEYAAKTKTTKGGSLLERFIEDAIALRVYKFLDLMLENFQMGGEFGESLETLFVKKSLKTKDIGVYEKLLDLFTVKKFQKKYFSLFLNELRGMEGAEGLVEKMLRPLWLRRNGTIDPYKDRQDYSDAQLAAILELAKNSFQDRQKVNGLVNGFKAIVETNSGIFKKSISLFVDIALQTRNLKMMESFMGLVDYVEDGWSWYQPQLEKILEWALKNRSREVWRKFSSYFTAPRYCKFPEPLTKRFIDVAIGLGDAHTLKGFVVGNLKYWDQKNGAHLVDHILGEFPQVRKERLEILQGLWLVVEDSRMDGKTRDVLAKKILKIAKATPDTDGLQKKIISGQSARSKCAASLGEI